MKITYKHYDLKGELVGDPIEIDTFNLFMGIDNIKTYAYQTLKDNFDWSKIEVTIEKSGKTIAADLRELEKADQRAIKVGAAE